MGVSRLDVALATVIAILTFSAGSAARPHFDLPWDRDEPAMAGVTAAQRLAQAQQSVQELETTRSSLQARLAEERLMQWIELAQAERASARNAEDLTQSISERELLIQALRDKLDAAADAQVPVSRELQVATKEAEASEANATELIRWLQSSSWAFLSLAAWAMLAIAFGLYRVYRTRFQRGRPSLTHGRFVLLGSLAGMIGMLVAVNVGWLLAGAMALLLLIAWVMRPEKYHG